MDSNSTAGRCWGGMRWNTRRMTAAISQVLSTSFLMRCSLPAPSSARRYSRRSAYATLIPSPFEGRGLGRGFLSCRVASDEELAQVALLVGGDRPRPDHGVAQTVRGVVGQLHHRLAQRAAVVAVQPALVLPGRPVDEVCAGERGHVGQARG